MGHELVKQNTALSKDISREGVTPDKLLQLGRLFAPTNNYAIVKVSKFSLIDINRINKLLGTNFRGAILDVDECMAQHHGEILQENTENVIKMVKAGVKVDIFSNMKASARYEPFVRAVREETGYNVEIILSKFAKPDPRGFWEAYEALMLENDEQSVMIGDNFVTDGGCIRAGIPFIKVKPIQTEQTLLQRIKRSPQTGSRAFYERLSDLNDFLSKRRVLRDDDLRE